MHLCWHRSATMVDSPPGLQHGEQLGGTLRRASSQGRHPVLGVPIPRFRRSGLPPAGAQTGAAHGPSRLHPLQRGLSGCAPASAACAALKRGHCF